MQLKRKIKLWNLYNNPFYHWWLVRKEFKRPKCHFIFKKNLWFFGLYINPTYYNRFIHIRTSAVGWKDKYDIPRHEWDPFIQIVFFRKWHMVWLFNWVDKTDQRSYISSMATWEAILDRIYYNKDLQTSINENTWGDATEGSEINILKNIRR
jgi:hypothetical protein